MNNAWRLPSKEELNAMYVQLHDKGLGGFASDNYWSSSGYGNNLAWLQYFGSGYQYYYYKDCAKRVRLVQDMPEADSNNPLVITLDGKYFEVAEGDEPRRLTWYKAMEKWGGEE